MCHEIILCILHQSLPQKARIGPPPILLKIGLSHAIIICYYNICIYIYFLNENKIKLDGHMSSQYVTYNNAANYTPLFVCLSYYFKIKEEELNIVIAHFIKSHIFSNLPMNCLTILEYSSNCHVNIMCVRIYRSGK